jgi:transcriptional regulator with XRE-family HTH domain
VENRSQETVSHNLNRDTQQSTDSSSRRSLIQRLKRGPQVRARFVESNISKALAFQIRSLRDQAGWSQQSLAEKIGSNQNAVYRAENPNYGKQTITTLKKIAAAFDVALVVRFVPFSELVDWVSGTPRIIAGLTTAALEVPCFVAENEAGAFDASERVPPRTERDSAQSETMSFDAALAACAAPVPIDNCLNSDFFPDLAYEDLYPDLFANRAQEWGKSPWNGLAVALGSPAHDVSDFYQSRRHGADVAVAPPIDIGLYKTTMKKGPTEILVDAGLYDARRA